MSCTEWVHGTSRHQITHDVSCTEQDKMFSECTFVVVYVFIAGVGNI